MIAPGVAHAETIRTFHSARFMEDPRAVQCKLDGNPLHEEQLEIVRMLGGVLALNTVIDDDRAPGLRQLRRGHRRAISRRSTSRARTRGCRCGRRFQTVVTCAAGYPLDKTYYQTVKGMVGPLDILEPGGDLIVASACSEGFGSQEFGDAQRRLCELGRGRLRVEHRWPSRSPTSTSGRPRCSSSRCASAACSSTPTASTRATRR